MTHQERADQIMADPMSSEPSKRELLRDAIVRVQIEAANDELEKRRAMEQQIANIQAFGPVIVADDKRTLLRVWNPFQKRWYETSLIACGEVQR